MKVKAWNLFSAIDQDAGTTTVVCLPDSNDIQNSVGFSPIKDKHSCSALFLFI